MTESIVVTVEEPTDVAEVRRHAIALSRSAGFDETRGAEVAIVATELSTNLLKHARGGQVLMHLGEESGDAGTVEILALDRGSGMSDVEQCLSDGYSTANSPGHGLGAVRRLSTEADFYSVPGEGTAILARWSSAPLAREGRLHVGSVNLPKKGQEVSGDSWGVEQNDECCTILLADGLGHGYEAKVASREAVRMLRAHPGASPQALVALADGALRSTRGAALAVARIDKVRGELAYCGVGNIMAQIYTGSRAQQHLVSTNGTAGHHAGKLREFIYKWPEHGMLVIYSDGLATSTGLPAGSTLAFHDPCLIAGVLYRDFTRNSDDATVVVARVV